MFVKVYAHVHKFINAFCFTSTFMYIYIYTNSLWPPGLYIYVQCLLMCIHASYLQISIGIVWNMRSFHNCVSHVIFGSNFNTMAHVCTCAYTLTHIVYNFFYICTHAVHTYLHACIHAYLFVYVDAYIYIHICTCVHVYI